MKIKVLWDVTSCRLVTGRRRRKRSLLGLLDLGE
jgi:hypothetical protein